MRGDKRSQIRNDGKARRKPVLGLRPQRPNLAPKLEEGESAPSWHELVLPAPKANAARTLQRREDRGQVTRLTHEAVVVDPSPRNPVRLGRWRTPGRAKAAPIADSARIRPVFGSRRPGFAEVRQGNVPGRMAKIRQRPIERAL